MESGRQRRRSRARSFAGIFVAGALPVACAGTGDPAAPSLTATAEPTTAGGPPTWYRDIEPRIRASCAECHSTRASGAFPLDRQASATLADLIAARVTARDMPPWPPGPASAPMLGTRALSTPDIVAFVEWARAGAPVGDPSDALPPVIAGSPLRAPDLRLDVHDSGTAYREPASQFVNDEVRCFAVGLPPHIEGAWAIGTRWVAGTGAGVRGMSGIVVDPDALARARAMSGRDGREGFECSGLAAGTFEGPPIGATGTGSSPPVVIPSGAVRIPAGGGILVTTHYAVKHLAGAEDRSSVELWLDARTGRRPMVSLAIEAPIEIPCATGISSVDGDPCARGTAFRGVEAARAVADERLSACATSLQSHLEGLVFSASPAPHFYVRTSCATAVPFDGTVRMVRPRMQTFGASVRVEIERADGTSEIVVDVPRWRWWGDATFALEDGVTVRRGDRVRVSCVHDNGSENQWSALTGEPGHAAPSRAPWLRPRYLARTGRRDGESCAAYLGVERAPHRSRAWTNLCDEAEAVVTDACGAREVDVTSRGCVSGADQMRVSRSSGSTRQDCAIASVDLAVEPLLSSRREGRRPRSERPRAGSSTCRCCRWRPPRTP